MKLSAALSIFLVCSSVSARLFEAKNRKLQQGTCMQDNYDAGGGNQGLTCTAKEVYIEERADESKVIDTVVVGPGCDAVGDTVRVSITASIHFNADRQDIGVYSAVDGGGGLRGDCAVDILTSASLDVVKGPEGTDAAIVVGTTGQFDAKGDPDSCGDVQFAVGGGGTLNNFIFQELVLTCEDTDADGLLDFTTCFSWRVDGNDDTCNVSTEVFPGSPSKCFCERVNIAVPVPPPQIDTKAPTMAPTISPTIAPTVAPTIAPTIAPTVAPTIAPTVAPTVAPTIAPTIAPTVAPTIAPTVAPTVAPTIAPTVAPTIAPTISPSASPSTVPSAAPTETPCDTAWALCPGTSECFSKKWGWANKMVTPGTTCELWAGAAKCDTSKGFLAGTVTVTDDNGSLTVEYNLIGGSEDVWLETVHVYTGPSTTKTNPGGFPSQVTQSFPDQTAVLAGIPTGDVFMAHAEVCYKPSFSPYNNNNNLS